MRIKTFLISALFCCLIAFPVWAGDEAPDFVATLKEFAGTGLGTYGCFFCPIYDVLFDALNNLATNVANKTADLFLLITGVGLLFLIAIKVGRLVTQMQEVDVMQFLEDLFKPLGRAMIATALLAFPLSIYYYLVSPVVQLSLTTANVIYTEAGAKELTVVKLARDQGGVNLTVTCDKPAIQVAGTPDKAFSPSVKESMICNLRQVTASLVVPMVLGSLLFLVSWFTGIFGVIPNFVLMGVAFILIGFYFCMLVSYATKFLDALMRLAFVGALMPLWIVLWIFPATAGYTKKAWDQLIGACFLFLSVNIVAAFILIMLDSAQFPDRFIDLLVQGEYMGAVAELTVSMVIACVLPFICMPLLGSAETLSGEIVGAQSLGLSEAADKHVATPMINMAKGAAVTSGATVGAVAKATKAGVSSRRNGGSFRAGFGGSIRESMTGSKLASWSEKNKALSDQEKDANSKIPSKDNGTPSETSKQEEDNTKNPFTQAQHEEDQKSQASTDVSASDKGEEPK